MGACDFQHQIRAISAKDAYNDLVESATYESGAASYNGTINTCSMGRRKKLYDKYSEKNLKDAYNYIESIGGGTKWVADYIDLGVVSYRVTSVKKVPKTYGAKFSMRYCVVELSYMGTVDTVYFFETKTLADKKAMELAMKNNKRYGVEKKYVNTSKDKTSSLCTEFILETKEYKTKPKLKPVPNGKIEEIREYIFFGWASS